MVTLDRARLARTTAPIAFLVALTIAVLVVRAGLRENEPASRPGASGSVLDGATAVVRSGRVEER